MFCALSLSLSSASISSIRLFGEVPIAFTALFAKDRLNLGFGFALLDGSVLTDVGTGTFSVLSSEGGRSSSLNLFSSSSFSFYNSSLSPHLFSSSIYAYLIILSFASPALSFSLSTFANL